MPRPLGQHFLKNKEIIRKIIEAAQLQPSDQVLEIGPGEGAITGLLAQNAQKVLAVELDEHLADNLPSLPNLKVLKANFLNINLAEILGSSPGKWKVVANLPYYITSPIIEKLLIEGSPFIESMVIMIQKEVADRIKALACRETGAFSYFVNYYAQVEMLFKVKPGSFNPPPQVDSAVIRLTPRLLPEIEAPADLLFKVTRTAFSARRKTLRKSLQPLAQSMNSDLDRAFQKANIPGEKRPEELTLLDFSHLATALQETSNIGDL
ncbi:ribosomal RNA small subunit methyltransferase A [bacterium]|nr:ribosomal RNA small subunit methyltransferase A [bacterium]